MSKGSRKDLRPSESRTRTYRSGQLQNTETLKYSSVSHLVAVVWRDVTLLPLRHYESSASNPPYGGLPPHQAILRYQTTDLLWRLLKYKDQHLHEESLGQVWHLEGFWMTNCKLSEPLPLGFFGISSHKHRGLTHWPLVIDSISSLFPPRR